MKSKSEIVNKLGQVQAQIWGTVSSIVSEACNQMVNFSDPLTVETSPSEMTGELTAPMLVIQFAFSDSQDKAQVVLINQETFAEFAGLIKPEPVEEIDDNLVVDVRPQMEAIVQGLCLAIGNVRNEPVVATGISIRYQLFQLPNNLQRSDFLARVQVALSAGDVKGTAIWLTDRETACYIANEEYEDEDEVSASPAFLQVQDGGTPAPAATSHAHDEPGSLGILMDIPLEISVELGRVKMVVRDILELGTGSIVEIDKAAGEPVDVMVNGRLVARGEVVVIEDNFGVRITEICNAMERLNRLNDAA